MELKKLMEHISIIPDYRQAWKVVHKLSDILLLTICAVISGAEGWEDIEDFGETHPDFLKQYGDFENGIPVHDTIARVVSCISPAKFHECFINWMRDCHSSDDKDVIAIDGKIHRHSYDKSRRKGAIHVISAFSTMHSLVIGQIKTDKKSNEITAIPELLNMLDIKGKIITTDAMGCQKDIAEKIQKQGGDYLFAVKGNQGRLNKAFEEKFPLKELNNPEHDSYAISEKSHGREEIRLHIVCDVPDELIDFTFEWKGLKKLCVAVSFRSIIAEQKKEPEMTVRYYISSADLTAEKFATAIRNHWHVENKLHWRLDVVMNEDDCKIRRGNAAELFSGIRHIAINILTNEKVFKAGMKRILLWEIEKQLEIWMKRMAIPESRITGVTIRAMKSRWGSCRRVTGRFSFALDLVTKPKDCIEAVVVHELCHLFIAGHGPDFYARMETYLPDYKERDRLLASLPRELI